MNLLELLNEGRFKTSTIFSVRAKRALNSAPAVMTYTELRDYIGSVKGDDAEKGRVLGLFRDKTSIEKEDVIDVLNKISVREFELKELGTSDQYKQFAITDQPTTFILKITYGTLKSMLERKKLFNESEETWNAMKKIFKNESLHFDQTMEVAFARIQKSGSYHGEGMWFIEEMQSDVEGQLYSQVSRLKSIVKMLNDKISKINAEVVKNNTISSLMLQELNRALVAKPEEMQNIINDLEITTEGKKMEAANAQFVLAKIHERLEEEKAKLDYFYSVLKSWHIYLLIMIIKAAKDDKASYLGWSKDTPAGLSKASHLYKRLYINLPESLGFFSVENPYYKEVNNQDWNEVRDSKFLDFENFFRVSPEDYGFINPYREAGLGRYDNDNKMVYKPEWEEYLKSGSRKKYDKWYTKEEALELAWERGGEKQMQDMFNASKSKSLEKTIWVRRLNMEFYKMLMGMRQ